jgi:translation initiation factor eIF-2B subunit alpha
VITSKPTLHTISPAHHPQSHPPLRPPHHTDGYGPASPHAINDDAVVREFHEALARSSDMAVAVAAIQALTTVIRSSTATTMMGLERDLKDAAAALQRCNPTAISLKAGCELFLRYTTRTSALEAASFDVAKKRLIERGRHFAQTSVRARATIAEQGERFIRPGFTVLCHGHSRVVLAVLRKAAASGRQFSVVVTEGRPDETGLTMARALEDLKVPVTVVLDSGVGYVMERVDMVLVGAEGVVESGGVINKLGTYTVALVAKAHGVPLYVAAESFKFARLFPLSQRDLPMERKGFALSPLLPASVSVDNPSRDYTPPSLVTLLFTDLGVLTPAGVSDELIMLYQ